MKEKVCPMCQGDGFCPQEVIVGYATKEIAKKSNGQYKEGDPIYDEEDDICPECDGTGVVEEEDWDDNEWEEW